MNTQLQAHAEYGLSLLLIHTVWIHQLIMMAFSFELNYLYARGGKALN